MIPISREFRRVVFLSLVILTVFQFTIYNFSGRSSLVRPSVEVPKDSADLHGELDRLLTADNIDLIINNQNHKNSISTTYKLVLSKYSVFLNKLDHKEKCQLYFSELYKHDPKWQNGAYKDAPYNTEVFNKNHYFLKHKEQMVKDRKAKDPEDQKKKDDDYVTNEDYYRVEYLYNQDLGKTIDTEQRFIDAMTNIRVFSQCYLQNAKRKKTVNFNDRSVVQSLNHKLTSSNFEPFYQNVKADHENSKSCQELESKIFPWLTRQLPIYQRWNGEIHWGIPNIKDTQESTGSSRIDKNKNFFDSRCFVQNFKSHISGKGIVITGSDNEVPDMINLLKLLRGLNNELPIQIIHKGDLSVENQNKLIRIARDNLKFDREIFKNIPVREIPNSFRKQELWFVNVAASIKSEYHEFFFKFYMKFLAYFFNSFEEILLMDTDAIPLIKPSSFFKLGPYKKSSTIFFKDRTSLEFLSDHDVIFFKKLLPTKVDENLFGIPKSTSKTLDNNLFAKKYKHSMEAGIVGINRKKKFASMLALIQLQLWTPANKRLWGDKESFWLSLSMVGDEQYEFNDNDAVSVGTPVFENLNIKDEKKDDDDHGPADYIEFNKKVKVCSSHPGHLSSDDNFTLLWINSGFKFCKKKTWEHDIKVNAEYKAKYNGNSTLLKQLYESNLQIRSVLLPEDNSLKRGNANSKKGMSLAQEKYINEYGWDMQFECESYSWCASELINNNGDLKNKNSLFIEYDDDLVNLYDYYGKIWVADVDAMQQDLPDDQLVEVGNGKKLKI